MIKKIYKIIISVFLIVLLIIPTVYSTTEINNLNQKNEALINKVVDYYQNDYLVDSSRLDDSFKDTSNLINNPEFDDFHDYNEVTTELNLIETNYPSISKLYNLGTSVQGRTIWGLKITDNPSVEENEAEVRICGAHHGNELMSVEMPLLIAWLLVENYSIDPYITDLVDNREIWIIPLVNPDGRQANTRYNANGVDLNRNYGYMWDGAGGSPFSQPETQAIRNHALNNCFVLSLSFHCSGDIVNYVWNYKGQPVADNDLVVQLSEQYGSHNGYWVVEGYDWYQTRGDTNDFSYGCRGDIDWTIEVQTSDIPGAWDLNRDAMIEIIDAANMGLTGIVTDETTGLPIPATVWVEEKYWPCFTDPIIGDYHRALLPGSYTVRFQANGYQDETYNIQVYDSDSPTVFNVELTPSLQWYAYQVTICRYYAPSGDFSNNPTEAINSLGPPDGVFASLGRGGEIVLDMGETGEIIDYDYSNDFVIYEGDDSNEGYQVFLSQNWNGPWYDLGTASGTHYFDIDGLPINTAQYVKIVDDGDSNAEEMYPGFDLDAIQKLPSPGSNDPPNIPSNPIPINGSIDVDNKINLSWDGGDPNENDTVYYDVYLEKNDPIPDKLVSNDQTDTIFYHDPFEYNTQYYWQIVAKDNNGAIVNGEIWTFRTEEEPNNPPYKPNNPNPINNSYDNNLEIDLSWNGGDPDENDIVTYKIYFEQEDPSPDIILSESQYETYFNLSTLEYGKLYYWRVIATDDEGATRSGPIWKFTTEVGYNNPPNIPTINGQTYGKTGTEYEYIFTAIDIDGDNIFYIINWGDETEIEVGPYNSGEAINQQHSWETNGTFIIKAKTRDIYGAESEWETLEIIMPKNHSFDLIQLIKNIFEKYPMILPLFKKIIGL